MKIELKNISKVFDNKTIFSDINKVFEQGKIYYIKGSSGSGKTTFLNVLSTVAYPTTGNVIVEDKIIISEKDKEEFRKKSGFIYQNSFLLEELTLEENVCFHKKYENTIINHYAEQLNLLGEMNKPAGVLSVGERQRGNILRALIKTPEIIFADEPCASLDLENSEIILDMLEKFVSIEKKTLFYVGHEKNAVFREAEEIIIHDGQIHFSF